PDVLTCARQSLSGIRDRDADRGRDALSDGREHADRGAHRLRSELEDAPMVAGSALRHEGAGKSALVGRLDLVQGAGKAACERGLDGQASWEFELQNGPALGRYQQAVISEPDRHA